MKLRPIIPALILALVTVVQLHGQNFIGANVKPADATSGVAQAIARSARSGEWVAWVVPTSAERSSCCWNRDAQITCSLDGGISDRKAPVNAAYDASQLVVMTRVGDGETRRIRIFGAGCPVDAEGKTIHLLANVTPQQSLDWLAGEVKNRSRSNDVIVAIALHEHPTVVPRLIELARNSDETGVRRAALFWLGQRAGEKATAELRRAVDEDPEERVREHAVFAISQLPDDRSVPMLIDLAKTHKSREVRKKAMFWLAQKDDPRALDAIEAILR
jgi:hypothetical protein